MTSFFRLFDNFQDASFFISRGLQELLFSDPKTDQKCPKTDFSDLFRSL
jgi:hypothetical protein